MTAYNRFGAFLAAAMAVLCAALLSPVVLAQSSADAEIHSEGDVADITYFYEALNEDGSWIEHPRYGQVWQPDVDWDWRPYTLGRWAYSETYGWTWISSETFGWAIYHYGRLTFDADYGWIWLPDRQWAPAWVVWRYNDEAIGWAPMPPETRFDRGRVFADPAAYESRQFLPSWVFASPKSFTRPNVYRFVRPTSWNRELLVRTRARISYERIEDRIVNRGLPPDELERMLNGPVPRAKVGPSTDESLRTAPPRVSERDGDLGDVPIYRPDRSRTEDIAKTNPQPKQAVKKPAKRPGGSYGRLPPRRERPDRDDEPVASARQPRPQDRVPEAEVQKTNQRSEEDARGNSTGKAYKPWRDDREDATKEFEEPAKPDRAATEDRRSKGNSAPDDSLNGRQALRDSDAPPAPAERIIRRGKEGGPVEYYQELPEPASGPGSSGSRNSGPGKASGNRAAPNRNEEYGVNGPFPQPELIDEPDTPPPGDKPKAKSSSSTGPSKNVEELDPVVPKQRPKSTAKSGADDDEKPTGSAASPSSTRASDRDSRKPAPASEPVTPANQSPKATSRDPAKKIPAPETSSKSASNARDERQRPQETGSTSKDDAVTPQAPTKSKKRWDQNGESGYPTVIGPDGKPDQRQ